MTRLYIVISSPAYLTSMQRTSNGRLDESQAGINTAKRNSNNLRYADDSILKAESKEESNKPLDEGENGE